jgi:hypothetical protein
MGAAYWLVVQTSTQFRRPASLGRGATIAFIRMNERRLIASARPKAAGPLSTS